MKIQIDNHLWELEGDLQASVFLDLVFEVRTRHHEVESIELLKDETNLQGVTFARGDKEIICDGIGRNPDLPDPLWLWFIERFHESYENIEAIKSGLLDQVSAKAVEASYEMQAA